MFNSEPKDEYILAKVEVSMDTVKDDKALYTTVFNKKQVLFPW